MSQLDVFDTTLQKTFHWLREIMRPLGWEDTHRAYLALRSVLHTLRDRLPVIEASHLGAQLPMLVRGIYYEGWDPVDKPEKMHRGEFLARVRDQFRNDPEIDPVRVTRAVFEVMLAELDPGEMSKILGVLPAEYADLWPIGAIR
jgi:uncharacterized protein (DUF2267 family)